MKKIEINTNSKTTVLNHFWSRCVGAGRAHEGLRSNWQNQLETVITDCKFKYIRFHGLFHDDMFVFRLKDGVPVYNFQYVDELFDRLLELGIRPFVEFGFSPADMASGSQTVFWWNSNSTPPKDYKLWSGLINNIVRHWLNRYGLEEISQWYFEVWNEPNLKPFWDGTKQQYFELYKVTVQTIKAIHPDLKAGGPATSNFVPDDRFNGEVEDVSKQSTFKDKNLDSKEWRPVWVEDFLQYCHENSLPVDFVSTHPYPTDTALDGFGESRGYSRGIDSTRNDLKNINRIVKNSSYSDSEIHLTEWSSSPSSRDSSHDHLMMASFIVKTNIDSTDLVDSLSFWTFTDVFEEGGAGGTIFHGGFGMINFQGIVKPSYHAYRFLSLLGDREIYRTDGCIVTRNSGTNLLSILGYNYPQDEVPQSVPMATDSNMEMAGSIQRKGTKKEFRLEISDVSQGTDFVIETVDGNHGYAINAWENIGMPDNPTREQTQYLKVEALKTKKDIVSADEDGLLELSIVIAPWSIVSIREL